MKEPTGEVSMTVITLVAIAVVGAIIAMMWPSIRTKIQGLWNNTDSTAQNNCQQAGGTWDAAAGVCR